MWWYLTWNLFTMSFCDLFESAMLYSCYIMLVLFVMSSWTVSFNCVLWQICGELYNVSIMSSWAISLRVLWYVGWDLYLV